MEDGEARIILSKIEQSLNKIKDYVQALDHEKFKEPDKARSLKADIIDSCDSCLSYKNLLGELISIYDI